VPEASFTVPIGEAAIAREGTNVTIVTLSLSVQHSLDVAEQLADDGISVEVIDLRSLVPLDTATVLASVAKTGRVLVVDEDYRSFGLTGETAAVIAEHDPTMLKKPFRRLAVPDVPIPYARVLEHGILPTREKIAAGVRDLMS
jgi:pyruvate dehydrogenase E1 component beta subunit